MQRRARQQISCTAKMQGSVIQSEKSLVEIIAKRDSIRRPGTLLLILFLYISGCSSSPVRPQISPSDLDRLSSVPQPTGPNALRNGHAAVLYQAQQQLNNTIIGGTPARQFPELRDISQQRDRQFANSVQERASTKIVGGRNVTGSGLDGLFHFQVALVYAGFPNVTSGQFCSGSLIASNWVLTAAHCVDKLAPTDLQVYVGSYELEGNGQLVNLAPDGIIKHEQYIPNDNYARNDIALLRLQSPISQIQPIGLVSEAGADNIPTITNLIISGWGYTTQGAGRGSNELQYASVRLVPFNSCTAAYGAGKITDGMICATTINTDTCQGDSGGPLVIVGKDKNFYEYGITSWGIGCAQSNYPGVYTSIQSYADWVKTHEK